jgi:hypothetical protein
MTSDPGYGLALGDSTMKRKPFALLAFAWLLLTAAAVQAQAPHQSQIDALMSRYAGDVPVQ